MQVQKVEKIVAIIGGGASGALTAFHLHQLGVDAKVLIIDPAQQLGLGLAYSTPSLRHLLNVPAGKISALPDEPDHFLRWLRTNYDTQATEKTFAPRAVFGRYLQSILSGVKGVEQVRASVIYVCPTRSGALLRLNNGKEIHAQTVILATGNFDPAPLPGISSEAIESGAYCHNAWIPETYDELAPDAPVVLIGTGLTGVDVVLRLRELGHRGTITAVSRHGVFPNRHTDYVPATHSAIPEGTQPTCSAYLKALRTAIKSGMEWRAAIDSLRATTNDLWLALSVKEQRRFKRHLQRRWDVVRHRMAPPIADIIDRELQSGTLVIREGHLARVDADEQGAKVTIRTAHGEQSLTAARVINCTGPSMNYHRVGSPLLNSLFAQGIAVSGPLGGGLNCTRRGALIDAKGRTSSVFFNLGPGRLGTLLESIAIPEIREQAVEVAQAVAARMATMEEMEREEETCVATVDEGELTAATVAA